MNVCPICGAAAGDAPAVYTVGEMMFRTGEFFSYRECAECLSLWLAAPPTGGAADYPPAYYSFSPGPASRSRLARIGLRLLCRHAVMHSPLQPCLLPLLRHRNTKLYLLGQCRLRPASRILDVGCGSGALVALLRAGGFRHVLGIDPHLPREVRGADGETLVVRQRIHQHQGIYDLIMFHHSFEHMDDPLSTLAWVRDHLSEGGECLIRMPTVSSWGWRHYRETWCQLDPPRHLFLCSVPGLRALAPRAGLRLERVIYDSHGFQFWGSERARNGRPVAGGLDARGLPEELSEPEMARLYRRAQRLNAAEEGDQAAFYLRRGPRP